MLRLFILLALTALSSFAGLPPGRPLAYVPVIRPNDKPLDLMQYRGKPLVLALLSTTCDECKEMMGILKELHKENAAAGLQIVGIVVEPIAKYTTLEFAKETQPSFPMGYLDLPEYQKLAAVPPGKGASLPILLFVDGAGSVRLQFFGNDPLMKKNDKVKQPHTIVRSSVRELIAVTKAGNK